jgi:hypothetical protein
MILSKKFNWRREPKRNAQHDTAAVSSENRQQRKTWQIHIMGKPKERAEWPKCLKYLQHCVRRWLLRMTWHFGVLVVLLMRWNAYRRPLIHFIVRREKSYGQSAFRVLSSWFHSILPHVVHHNYRDSRKIHHIISSPLSSDKLSWRTRFPRNFIPTASLPPNPSVRYDQ